MSDQIYLSNAGLGRNQAYRTALGLAASRGIAVRLGGLVDDGPKPKPGLGPGGFTAAVAAAAVCGGNFSLGREGAEIDFTPAGRPLGGDYAFDVARERPSPAGVSLVLEPLVPALCRADGPASLILSGGTHVPLCPTSDELRLVYVPTWRALGVDIEYTEITPGFMPHGSGEAEVRIKPASAIKPLQAETAFRPRRLGLELLTCGLPVHLAEQALEGARDRLALHHLKAETRLRRAQGQAGMGLLAWAQGEGYWVGFSALGRRGGRPEALANSACEALVNFLRSGAGLPSLMAARLLALLTLSGGISLLTVDHMSLPLKGALAAAQRLAPGAVRVNHPRREAPLEMRITGQGLI